ncbi:MAG: hypothetical protein WBG70_07370 [Spirulinaceae cyanobacterium]
MPFSINGIGTNFYGKREFNQDGSYVTTEWIIFIFFPIVPLRSFRVFPRRITEKFLFFPVDKYRVLKVPISWKQVKNTYIVGILSLLAIVAVPLVTAILTVLTSVIFPALSTDFLAWLFLGILILLGIAIAWLLKVYQPPQIRNNHYHKYDDSLNLHTEIVVIESQLQNQETIKIQHPEKDSQLSISLHPRMQNKLIRCSGAVADGLGDLIIYVRVVKKWRRVLMSLLFDSN